MYKETHACITYVFACVYVVDCFIVRSLLIPSPRRVSQGLDASGGTKMVTVGEDGRCLRSLAWPPLKGLVDGEARQAQLKGHEGEGEPPHQYMVICIYTYYMYIMCMCDMYVR